MAPKLEGWIVEDKVTPASQLQQGDLIAFRSDDPLRRYGVIVTADCDLEHKKHARLVTMVPVIELGELVEHYLLLEQCDKQSAQLISLVQRTFELHHWPSLPEDFAELRARIEEQGNNPAMSAPCLAARLLLHEIDKLSPAEYTAVMTAARVNIGDMRKKVDAQVKSKGDILLLPTLMELGIAADIAWMRHIWQMPLRNIVLRNSETRDDTGQKVARLDSPYRYRLTQLMAQVFSDIGLPDVPRNFSEQLATLFP